MNASELRIGNYLQDRKNNLCKVNKISSENFDARAVIGALTYLPVEGIPLTEEWLLKFGFEKFNPYPFKEYWSINDFEIEIHGDIFPVRIYGGESAPHLTQFIGHNTKYVHQLQNLYFALTGQELK